MKNFKMNKLAILLILVLGINISMSSCKKDDQPTPTANPNGGGGGGTTPVVNTTNDCDRDGYLFVTYDGVEYGDSTKDMIYFASGGNNVSVGPTSFCDFDATNTILDPYSTTNTIYLTRSGIAKNGVVLGSIPSAEFDAWTLPKRFPIGNSNGTNGSTTGYEFMIQMFDRNLNSAVVPTFSGGLTDTYYMEITEIVHDNRIVEGTTDSVWNTNLPYETYTIKGTFNVVMENGKTFIGRFQCDLIVQ